MKQDLRVVGNHALHNDGGGRRVVETQWAKFQGLSPTGKSETDE